MERWNPASPHHQSPASARSTGTRGRPVKPLDDDDVPDPGDLGHNFLIPVNVLCALTNLSLPLTVDGLLELANRALAGQSTDVASIPEINQAVDAINEGFDECRFLINHCNDVLECPPPVASLLSPNNDRVFAETSYIPFEVAPFASSYDLLRPDTAHSLFSLWAMALVDAKARPAYFRFGL